MPLSVFQQSQTVLLFSHWYPKQLKAYRFSALFPNITQPNRFAVSPTIFLERLLVCILESLATADACEILESEPSKAKQKKMNEKLDHGKR